MLLVNAPHIPIRTILILSLVGRKANSLRHVLLLLRQVCQSKVIYSALSNKLLSQSSLFGHLCHDQLFALLNRIHLLIILLMSLLRIREERSLGEGLHLYLVIVKLSAHLIDTI